MALSGAKYIHHSRSTLMDAGWQGLAAETAFIYPVNMVLRCAVLKGASIGADHAN